MLLTVSSCVSFPNWWRAAYAGTSPSGRQLLTQTTWTLSCEWSCWAAKKMMALQVEINSAIASALRSDYYLDGKGIKFVHGFNSNTGSSPIFPAFVPRGWHMRRKPKG